MGTQYKIVIKSQQTVNADTILNKVTSILNDVNSQMSTYDSDSEISKFNSSQTENDFFKISDYFSDVLEMSFFYNRISEGFFDITIKPLYELWGFQNRKISNKEPSSLEISRKLNFIGMDKIEFDLEHRLISKKHKQTSIDLSAIAKGYAVDLIASYLDDENFSDYFVEIGGEIKVKSNITDGWIINIQDPVDFSKAINSVYLLGGAIATSGNYFNYIEYLGVGSKRTHIINPLTGYPLEVKDGIVSSATVISDDCVDADALATILMLLDINKGITFIESLKDTEAYMVYYDNNKFNSIESSGFSNYRKNN